MTEKDVNNFRLELLKMHNCVRSSHGCPELSPSDDLTEDAQTWADTLADKGYLQYSELTGVGENITFLELNGKSPSGEEVTNIWYKECSTYDYNNPRWRKHSINFTQMVWKSTTEMGVGITKVNGQGIYVVVTQYRPAGNNNMPGEFKRNVPPKK